MTRHAIHLGTAWESPSASGGSRWVRRFGRPTGVEAADRLLLVCEGVGFPAVWSTATLNDRLLEWRAAGPQTLESDVTELLAERNLLAVAKVNSDAESGKGETARATIPSAWGRLSLVVVSD